MYLWERLNFNDKLSVITRYEEKTFGFRIVTLTSVLLIFLGVSYRIGFFESLLLSVAIGVSLYAVSVFRSRRLLFLFLLFMLIFNIIYFNWWSGLTTFLVSPLVYFSFLTVFTVIMRKLNCLKKY
jgi:hypothetical protein